MEARVFLRALTAAAVFVPAAIQAQAAPAKAGSQAPTSQPRPAAQAAGKLAPRLTVDYQWPKPLPTNKLLGSVLGVAVDAHDHVFVVHNVNSFTTRTETGADQTPPIAECCFSEQPIIQFDAAGNRVKSWGGPGPGYEWPSLPSGIAVAPNGNVWITGSGGLDGQVLVFSHDGAFIRQIGKAGTAPAPAGRGAADTAYQGVSPGARGAAAPPAAAGGGRGGRGGRGAPPPSLPPNNASTEMFGGATRVSFSADGKTVFIADGLRNRRVVEIDPETGAIRKFWGASGATPSDVPTPAYSPTAQPSAQFSGVTCAEPSKDGMLYVCDRGNDRIQVFKLDGSFVKEVKVAGGTLGDGSVWDIAFSSDPAQRYLYVADGVNHKVRILDRATLTEITNFGEGGRIPGQFYAVGSLAVDSKGNVYTGESLEGKRIQKFVYGGLAPVTKTAQGVLWPVRAPK